VFLCTEKLIVVSYWKVIFFRLRGFWVEWSYQLTKILTSVFRPEDSKIRQMVMKSSRRLRPNWEFLYSIPPVSIVVPSVPPDLSIHPVSSVVPSVPPDLSLEFVLSDVNVVGDVAALPNVVAPLPPDPHNSKEIVLSVVIVVVLSVVIVVGDVASLPNVVAPLPPDPHNSKESKV